MRDFNEWVIIKRWQDTGLLGLTRGQSVWNDYRMEECALALEGQRLHNESFDDVDNVAQFKRISIPVIRRIFGHCEKDIKGSSVPQPYDHVAEDIHLYSTQVDGHSVHNLDYEAAYCADVAKRLAERVDDLAGDQKLILHCISVENMGMARVFKINYGLE